MRCARIEGGDCGTLNGDFVGTKVMVCLLADGRIEVAGVDFCRFKGVTTLGLSTTSSSESSI